jgi:GDP-D-mannose dehydratase
LKLNLKLSLRIGLSVGTCPPYILFNHDSPLRPERFVTQKIVASAVRIAAGTQDKLYLGNIDIQRDWGWAEDYVVAMYLMLQQEQSDDYKGCDGGEL